MTILVLKALQAFSRKGTVLDLYAFNNQLLKPVTHQYKAMANEQGVCCLIISLSIMRLKWVRLTTQLALLRDSSLLEVLTAIDPKSIVFPHP
ncbi:MAG: hypothetical protein M3Y53_04215 [Thermoproteota archaeon]|nr:hypothetical protein [Thermoproteota archaeon]